ncbi:MULTISPECIES: phosphatase PAP2 family protein [Pedobacter]|uniref:phosphatase PAP2 family protein n=1 Tax=Pedobacter TaxID=84567 RepID=UPI00210EF435|nr:MULTISPECIES: phosphatase PAP2 family protein [unclassified Pedobacter]
MIEALLQFDHDLFLDIHRGMSNPFFDWLLPLMRNKYFWAPLYLFIIVYCVREYKKKGWLIVGMLLFTFALGDLSASRVIKPTVGRLRPCNEPALSGQIIARVPCGAGYSFPSAHATNHFALSVFCILVFYRRWKPILPIALFWAAIITFSQIYVGVHYPVDTLIGAMLGTTIGILTSKLYKTLEQRL